MASHEKADLAAEGLPGSDTSDIKWVRSRRTFWQIEPRWVKKPELTTILATVKATLDIQTICTIDFLAEGAFNKLYTVQYAEKDVVARVTLPIEPKFKTLSEVATLQWVRENTSLPVPRVLGHDATRNNPIGFEWIIMEKASGKTLNKVWKDISYLAKEKLVRDIAAFCSETFSHQRHGIGNLISPLSSEVTAENGNEGAGGIGTDDRTTPAGFTVGRMVHGNFCGYKANTKVSRGPFRTSREWICARLDMTEYDCKRRLKRLQDLDSKGAETEEEVKENFEKIDLDPKADGPSESGDSTDNDTVGPDDDDEAEDLETILEIISKLRKQLDDFFPIADTGVETEPEPSMIFHDDMSQRNILVDEKGNLTAIVDWEFVSAQPLYAACKLPPFLEARPNEIQPLKSEWENKDGEIEDMDLFLEHLELWELTQFRKLFQDEMRRLQPEWVEIFEASQRQRDFDLAVATCDDDFSRRRVLNWLNDLESGKQDIAGLEERIDNGTL